MARHPAREEGMSSQGRTESDPHRWNTVWPLNSYSVAGAHHRGTAGLGFLFVSGSHTGRNFFRKLLGFLDKLDSVDTDQQGQ